MVSGCLSHEEGGRLSGTPPQHFLALLLQLGKQGGMVRISPFDCISVISSCFSRRHIIHSPFSILQAPPHSQLLTPSPPSPPPPPGIQHPIDAAAMLAEESRLPMSNGRVRPM